jgi:DNA-binding NtrC family response regulator
VIVSSALKAIRELERGVFDLVVSDLEMPGLKGSDLLRMVAERWPATRRLLLTGHTSGALLEASADYADEIVDKILAHEIITATICRLATTPRNGKQQRTANGETAGGSSPSASKADLPTRPRGRRPS